MLSTRIWEMYVAKQFSNFTLEMYSSEEYWRELTNLMLKARNILEKNNAKILFVLFPSLDALAEDEYVFSDIHSLLSQFWQESNIPFVDLTKAYRSYGPSKLKIHADDAHPNEIAHEIAAKAIMAAISPILLRSH